MNSLCTSTFTLSLCILKHRKRLSNTSTVRYTESEQVEMRKEGGLWSAHASAMACSVLTLLSLIATAVQTALESSEVGAGADGADGPLENPACVKLTRAAG